MRGLDICVLSNLQICPEKWGTNCPRLPQTEGFLGCGTSSAKATTDVGTPGQLVTPTEAQAPETRCGGQSSSEVCCLISYWILFHPYLILASRLIIICSLLFEVMCPVLDDVQIRGADGAGGE